MEVLSVYTMATAGSCYVNHLNLKVLYAVYIVIG